MPYAAGHGTGLCIGAGHRVAAALHQLYHQSMLQQSASKDASFEHFRILCAAALDVALPSLRDLWQSDKFADDHLESVVHLPCAAGGSHCGQQLVETQARAAHIDGDNDIHTMILCNSFNKGIQ